MWRAFWHVAVFLAGLLLALVCLRVRWPADGNWLDVTFAVAHAVIWPWFFWVALPRMSFSRKPYEPDLAVFHDDKERKP